MPSVNVGKENSGLLRGSRRGQAGRPDPQGSLERPFLGIAWVSAWLTDFRADLPKIDVPTLVVQGDVDRILPIDATGRRLPGLIKDVRFMEIAGGPHAIGWTHAEEVNSALMDFLGR